MSEALLEELKRLRKGRGVSLAKLTTCSNMLAVFETPDPREAQARLVEAIGSLNQGPHIEALRHAYGFTPEPEATLTQRRNSHAAETYRHTKTIEQYENQAIEELAALLAPTATEFSIKLRISLKGRSLKYAYLRRENMLVNEMGGVMVIAMDEGYQFILPAGWDGPDFSINVTTDADTPPMTFSLDGVAHDLTHPALGTPYIETDSCPTDIRLRFLEES